MLRHMIFGEHGDRLAIRKFWFPVNAKLPGVPDDWVMKNGVFPPEAETVCARIIRERKNLELLEKRNIPPSKNLLIRQKPGMFAELLVRGLAQACNLPLVEMRTGSWLGENTGQTLINVEAALSLLLDTPPCIAFIPEYNILVPEEFRETLVKLILKFPPSILVVATEERNFSTFTMFEQTVKLEKIAPAQTENFLKAFFRLPAPETPASFAKKIGEGANYKIVDEKALLLMRNAVFTPQAATEKTQAAAAETKTAKPAPEIKQVKKAAAKK